MARPRAAVRNSSGFADFFEAITENVDYVVRGKDAVIRLALVCMVAEGHLLIEDVPGVGKTSLAKAIAASIECEWHRIQFTPDLLPSDVTGVTVYNRARGSFDFRPGGIFANIVLGDEINRASPKTQAALLEAMEERQVTIDAITYGLPAPFMVIATQNPVEHEGTYPLPESQLDRFLMRIEMGYPDREAEISMLESEGAADTLPELEAVATPNDIAAMIAFAREVTVSPAIKSYIVDLAEASRSHGSLALGMSPRAALAMQRAARALAASQGRDFVSPDDIKTLARPVLEHRLALTAEARLGGQDAADVIGDLLNRVPVPLQRGIRSG